MLRLYNNHFEHIKSNNPSRFIDYFGGTGIMSVWIHQNFNDCDIVINEFNSQIVGIYNAIKYDYQNFLEIVKTYDTKYIAMPHLHDDTLSKEDINKSQRKMYYLEVREEYASIENIATKQLNTDEAAMLYFMMCNNFNGIWQARRADNVYFTPFGNGWRKNSLMTEYKQALDDFHEMIQSATIVCQSFENLKLPVVKNTVHYFDPPYVNSHTRYSDDAFNRSHTNIMIGMMESLNNQGDTVLMSNKESDLFDFSKSFKLNKFAVKYTVSSKDTSKAVEILVHNIKKRRGANLKYKAVKLTTVEYDSLKYIRKKHGSYLVNLMIDNSGYEAAISHYLRLSDTEREDKRIINAKIKAIKIISIRAGEKLLLDDLINQIGKQAIVELTNGLIGKAVMQKIKAYGS